MIISFILLVALKFVQAVLGFLIVKQLIHAWGLPIYGTWVTMTSVITYMTMFDFGIGYGIKNRISEASARGNYNFSDTYVRIGLIFYFFISIAILTLGLLTTINIIPFKNHKLASIFLWLGCTMAFFLSYANIILQGEGRFVQIGIIAIFTPMLWLLTILITRKMTFSINHAALVYAFLIFCQGVFSALAARRLGYFRTSFLFEWDSATAKILLRTGAKFFFLQITSLTIFYSGNTFIFAQLGPADTAVYDATSKVFSILTIGFSVLISIAWTEISRARVCSDWLRMRNIFLLLYLAAGGVCVCGVFISWNAEAIVHSLTGIYVSSYQAYPFALLAGIQALAFAGAVYLNAFEELNGQIVLGVLSIPLFFTTAYMFFQHGLGIVSIPWATVVALVPTAVYCCFRAKRLIDESRHYHA